MAQDFDLLGDPIPEGFGKRGRPPHVATEEKRRLVIQLLAFDWTLERIAAALSITPPTLRKNYFRELKMRAESEARVQAKLLGLLMTEAEQGNVSAIEKYLKRLDKYRLEHLAETVANRPGVAGHKGAVAKKGIKEQRRDAAGQVSGKFAPPAAPKSIN